MMEKEKLPWPLYNKYFEQVSSTENNITVRCKLCAPSLRTYSTNKRATSNLRKHLQVGRLPVSLQDN